MGNALRKKLCAGVFVLFVVNSLVLGADWPNWRGPKHDGISAETGFKKTWKGTGARVKTITDLKKRMQEGIEIYHAPSEKRRYKFRVNEEGVIERSILKEEVGESESREVL